VLLLFLSLSASLNCSIVLADEPIKGGVQQTDVYSQPATYVPSYGAPKMVGMPIPKHVTPPPKPKLPPPPKTTLKATAVQEVIKPPPPKIAKPMPAAPMKDGVLPAQFLGRWQVMGSRSNVEAQPQFQQGIDGIFQFTTSNVWNIQGSPEQGYMLSTDSGVSTPLAVSSNGSQAVLRYQHPIKNTVAQEALVMQLGPGGASFDGLERITIIKQGEPPRAKVTYKLVGRKN
jgi:hypothetical protein